MKTPPKIQVDTMPAGKYFAYAAELMKLQPPHITDEPIIARMKRIGIEPGKSFDLDKANPAVKKALEGVPNAAQKLMEWKIPTLARIKNGWSMNTDTMGVYGNYYLKRAIVAQLGLGANLPEDGSTHSTWATSRANHSTARTSIRFTSIKGPRRLSTPSGRSHSTTRRAFRWPNNLNRFAVSSWMPFQYGPDGSLDLYFQNESPGSEKGGQLASGSQRALQPLPCACMLRSQKR